MLKLLGDRDFRKLFLLALFIVIFYILLTIKFDLLAIPKLNILDAFFKASHHLKPLPQELNQIVIVAIDDYSYELMGKRWPWGRLVYADLINKLNTYSPKVVSFDLAMVGSSENPADDILYAKVIKNAGNIIVGSYFTPQGEYVVPDKIFQQALFGLGIINKPRDKDLYVRSARTLFFKDGKVLDYSFEIKTICGFKGIPLNQIFYTGKEVVLKGSLTGKKDIRIPIRKDGTMPINYLANLKEFKVISFWDALNKNFPQEVFKNKIVLVGATAEVFHDIYHTPLGLMSGVVINANQILTIMSQRFIQELPDIYNYLILIAIVILTVFLTYLLSPIKGLIISLLELMIFIGISFYLFLKDFRLDYFSPVLMISLSYLGTNAYKYLRLMLESASLKRLAITDGLTGLFVPRYFQVRIENEFQRVLRYGNNLSLVIMDIDHFKKINDTFGHPQGNIILKAMADILRSVSRKADVLIRFGGEEFCMILPNTPELGAKEYTERLRKTIEDYNFPGPKEPLKITASFGIANVPKQGISTAEEFIACADIALYRAKNTGRNRVCVFDTELDKLPLH